MTEVLVSGGAGLIGSRDVDLFVLCGCEVVAVADLYKTAKRAH